MGKETSVKKRIQAVAAVDANGGIGVNNKLPWHNPEDLQRFKTLTTETICIMGRNTFESLGRPEGLPNRLNVVVSTTYQPATFDSESKKCFSSLEEALEYSHSLEGYDLISLIGGSEIFNKAFAGLADDIFLTIMGDHPECDTFVDLDPLMENYEPLTEEISSAHECVYIHAKRRFR